MTNETKSSTRLAVECITRMKDICKQHNHEFNDVFGDPISRMIDLTVSNVNLPALLEASESDFIHDMCGIFNNMVRDTNNPKNSKLSLFVPRVGFMPAQ